MEWLAQRLLWFVCYPKAFEPTDQPALVWGYQLSYQRGRYVSGLMLSQYTLICSLSSSAFYRHQLALVQSLLLRPRRFCVYGYDTAIKNAQY
jgi:hypothetical protein